MAVDDRNIMAVGACEVCAKCYQGVHLLHVCDTEWVTVVKAEPAITRLSFEPGVRLPPSLPALCYMRVWACGRDHQHINQ